MDKFRLIPEEVPAISKSTLYQKMLEEFSAGRAESCRVECAKKRPATIHQGLLKAKRNNAAFAPVQIVRRGEAVYLKK